MFIEIVELPTYRKMVKKVMTQSEMSELRQYLKFYPQAGVVIAGTGGIRKMRWGLDNKGKRGGGRAIYYYRKVKNKVYLIAFYKKSSKSDLSLVEKRQLKQLSKQLDLL